MPPWLDLPLAWAALLVLAVTLYVLLDGFDLGVGILFPFAPNDADRDRMMHSIAPVWDGNETWLVLGGTGLFAAFPAAYAAMLPALYMPVGFLLTALIFRGVAFEFRARAHDSAHRRLWDQAFHWGSVVAAFAQGLILGGLVQGIEVRDGAFAGGAFDWLTPFAFTAGWGLLWGYTLLGACWLTMKARGDLLAWARRAARLAAWVVLGMMALLGTWTIWLPVPVAARWGLDLPGVDWVRLAPLLPLPLFTVVVFAGLTRALRAGATYRPYLYAVALFLLGQAGLLVGLWPYLVPYALTVEDAAATPESQAFLLVGSLVLLPVTLGYTGYVYWTFRGKTEEGAEGY